MALLSTYTLNNDLCPSIVPSGETILFFVNFSSEFSNNLDLTSTTNPLDQCLVDYVDGYVKGNNLTLIEWIYPIQEEIASTNLSSLMQHLRVPNVSPLGLRVHREYGSWWAFRAVIRVKGHLGRKPFNLQESACLQCSDHACISSCKGDALRFGEHPDLQKCFDYRIEDNSLCARTCTARFACPYGEDYRYSDTLTDYLYKRSLRGIEDWLDLKTK